MDRKEETGCIGTLIIMALRLAFLVLEYGATVMACGCVLRLAGFHISEITWGQAFALGFVVACISGMIAGSVRRSREGA